MLLMMGEESHTSVCHFACRLSTFVGWVLERSPRETTSSMLARVVGQAGSEGVKYATGTKQSKTDSEVQFMQIKKRKAESRRDWRPRRGVVMMASRL